MFAWFRRWRQRRADERAIKESLRFLNKWNRYDFRKSEEAPLIEDPILARAAEMKRRAFRPQVTDASEEFDASVRRLTTTNRPVPTDEELIGQWQHRGESANGAGLH